MSADLAEALLTSALEARASDLHLDPSPESVRVRLRVDGRFVPLRSISRQEGQLLVGRLKVLAQLLVYRCDVPQEGRIPLPRGREGRLALIPTPHGEKATLRLFDPEANRSRLEELGLPASVATWLRARCRRADGLILLVGPSGSGKTTTLYGALHEILETRGDFCQIATVEDPIERHLDGCTQVQVDALRDLDFAAALKFLLRQDPEVLMVGEIRDAETARIAVRAAMTGHLVLSSMHGAHAGEARHRLLEMGVPRYAVDLALAGVVAQRLLRRACEACRASAAAASCTTCLGTGYRGRVPIAEVASGADGEKPVESLRDAARTLVREGATTEDEVRRVLGEE